MPAIMDRFETAMLNLWGLNSQSTGRDVPTGNIEVAKDGAVRAEFHVNEGVKTRFPSLTVLSDREDRDVDPDNFTTPDSLLLLPFLGVASMMPFTPARITDVHVRSKPDNWWSVPDTKFWVEVHERDIDAHGEQYGAWYAGIANGTVANSTKRGWPLLKPSELAQRRFRLGGHRSLVEDAICTGYAAIGCPEGGGVVIVPAEPRDIAELTSLREGPLTGSRRAPILHWVSSHLRRVKTKPEPVVVKGHQRGIEWMDIGEFHVGITLPLHVLCKDNPAEGFSLAYKDFMSVLEFRNSFLKHKES